MTKTPAYLTQALALARAAKAAGVPRLAAWGDQLEQANLGELLSKAASLTGDA